MKFFQLGSNVTTKEESNPNRLGQMTEQNITNENIEFVKYMKIQT